MTVRFEKALSGVLDEEELERQHLRGKIAPFRIQMGYPILELLFVLPLILLPAAVVYFCYSFETYDIFDVKIPGRNEFMEFIRWSVFFAIMYAIFSALEIAVQIAPSLITWLTEVMTGRESYTARRRMHYARDAKQWFAIASFFLALAVVSASILYDSSFLESVKKTFSSSSNQNIGSTMIERLFVVAFLFAGLIAVAKYALAAIAYNFHRSAFSLRIHRSNRSFDFLDRLYKFLSRGIVNGAAGQMGSGHNALSKNYSRKIELSMDRGMDLSSAKRCEEIATVLFVKLCPRTRDYLKPDDIRPYVDSAEVVEAFAIFDKDQTGQVNHREMQAAVYSIFEERTHISRSLEYHGKIVRKLDVVFFLIAILVALLLALSLFQVQKTAIIIVFAVIYGGINYVMQEGLRGLYESINFIFVAHPFDVGDRVIINKEPLWVDKIELFSTIFRQSNGTAVYMANPVLAKQTIYNLKRAGNSCESFPLTVATSVAMEQIWSLRDKIREWAAGEPKDYTGFVDIVDFEIQDGTRTTLNVIVEYVGNFHNEASKTRRHRAVEAVIKQSCAELGIA